MNYTVTLIEATTSGDVTFEEEFEGDNKFASLDPVSNIMTFETEDGSLAGKKFAVFIRAHVNVTLEIQEPLAVLLDPFYVTVRID